MEQDLHHPSPRLPEGWKQFQADNIDVTTISDMPTNTHGGRHSRSPSVLSNHSGYINKNVIQPSQIQNSNGGHNFGNDSMYNNGENTAVQNTSDYGNSAQYVGDVGQGQDIFQQHQPSVGEFEFPNNPEMRHSNVTSNNSSYFRYVDTASLDGTATGAQHNTLNQNSELDSNSNIDDFYLSSTDPSSSPYINANKFTTSTTSPPIVQDNTLSHFAPHHNPFDAQPQYEVPSSNTLGLHWSHHRSHSEQSDLSSNAASPYIGSVHSEHGSPFIGAQPDSNFDDDLREAILGLDIENMGAPFDVAAQYQNTRSNFDTSNLPLDQQGFPLDAHHFSSERQEQYYDQQPQEYQQQQQTSRPGSSSSYHHPSFPQSIFSAHPSHINTSLPPAFQSPPLPSSTSIPEIEVTVAPPTPRSQAFGHFEYFPSSYAASRYQQQQQQRVGSAHNSPSIAPTYLVQSQDLIPLSLPSTAGRRRAVSDSGTRPTTMAPMLPPSNTTLIRRVSSGSHPYLGVHESSPGSSGRSTPNRGYHRKSFSHGGHNMTAREVLELVKNEGPREAKNPKKFICDYPGCNQRFTRNSNKTYFLSLE